MIPIFLLSVAGIFLDPRIITGVPAWLKPAKFAISTSIYCLTLAWVFNYITPGTRFAKVFAWTIAIVVVLEVAIIDVQAARGVTSHFNDSTPLDARLFTIMGIAIIVLWMASIGIAILLFRQRFADSALGWALRLGMAITVAGSAVGGLMLRPPPPQPGMVRTEGAHTVGAPDGGPGLPVTGWSTGHGDLRVPHFLGLHAIQVIPLLAWILGRRRSEQQRTRTVILAAASYLALIGILTWQALRGQSIVSPEALTLTALGIWLTATAMATISLEKATEKATS
jgi:hypothetical protein